VRRTGRVLEDLRFRGQRVDTVDIPAGTERSDRRRRWIASKGAGSQIGDIFVRRNTMRSPTGGLVFVFGGRGAARGPFVFEGNRLQVTGAVTDEGAVGAFFFSYTNTIEIRNNQIDLPPRRDMPVVELRSCRHVVVDGNQVENGGRLVMADGASDDVHTSE
jgi:hypothetical protein